jgi:hypothetical protein
MQTAGEINKTLRRKKTGARHASAKVKSHSLENKGLTIQTSKAAVNQRYGGIDQSSSDGLLNGGGGSNNYAF